MTTRDHNEGIERETALQRPLVWVNSHGLCAISILPAFKASAMEGNIHEKILPSTRTSDNPLRGRFSETLSIFTRKIFGPKSRFLSRFLPASTYSLRVAKS
jgi:hypothetical protein